MMLLCLSASRIYNTFSISTRSRKKKTRQLLYCIYFLFTQIEVHVIMPERFQDTASSRKVVGKNVHATVPKGNMGFDLYAVPDTVAVESSIVAFLYLHSETFAHGLLCHSFKFLWRTKNSKPPTIPFGTVECTFFDNFSRNRFT